MNKILSLSKTNQGITIGFDDNNCEKINIDIYDILLKDSSDSQENKNINNYLDQIPNLFKNGVFEIDTFNNLFDEVKEKFYSNDEMNSNQIVKHNETNNSIYSYIGDNDTGGNYKQEVKNDQVNILKNIKLDQYRKKRVINQESVKNAYKNKKLSGRSVLCINAFEAILLTPAILPLKINKIKTANPIKIPPVNADKGVKFIIVIL